MIRKAFFCLVFVFVPNAQPQSMMTGIGSIRSTWCQQFLFETANGHLWEFAYNGSWGQNDMTNAAGGPAAALGGGIAGFVDATGEQHFVYMTPAYPVVSANPNR